MNNKFYFFWHTAYLLEDIKGVLSMAFLLAQLRESWQIQPPKKKGFNFEKYSVKLHDKILNSIQRSKKYLVSIIFFTLLTF